MDVLAFALFLAPIAAIGGLILNAVELSRIRRFVPSAFESGLTLLSEAVAQRAVTGDPNCIARANGDVVLFVRRTVSAAFATFPAARIVGSGAQARVQVRIGWGYVIFRVALISFFAVATALTHSPALALFVAASGLSVVVIVRRERSWARSAALSAVLLARR